MANRFWVGDGGNWSDALNHWSASTGGAPNASKPTNADNVYFDANSFTIGAQTVVVDENSNCLDFVWTGATNTPAITSVGFRLDVYGSFTLIAAMTYSCTTWWRATTTGYTITTAGNVLNGTTINGIGGGWTLQDDLSTGDNDWNHTMGTVDTAEKTVTARRFICSGSGTRVLTLGASILNIAGFSSTGFEVSGSNFTINAGTSTIKIASKHFEGGGATYYNVELNGTAHTIDGSNTFSTLTLKADTTQTITFTDGTTQTITTPVITGSSGKVKTLVGSSTAGWTITKAGGGTVSAEYLALSYSTGTPGQTWYASNSTDTVGNSGWIFAWIGKINGVTNPAKINGIAVATIAEVNGVV